jgi:hypothetical protein
MGFYKKVLIICTRIQNWQQNTKDSSVEGGKVVGFGQPFSAEREKESKCEYPKWRYSIRLLPFSL